MANGLGDSQQTLSNLAMAGVRYFRIHLFLDRGVLPGVGFSSGLAICIPCTFRSAVGYMPRGGRPGPMSGQRSLYVE